MAPPWSMIAAGSSSAWTRPRRRASCTWAGTPARRPRTGLMRKERWAFVASRPAGSCWRGKTAFSHCRMTERSSGPRRCRATALAGPAPASIPRHDIDPARGYSYVYAFRPGAANLEPVWLSNDETLGTAVVRVDATTIYLSSYAAGKTHLKAVRVSDGGNAWPADALFDSSQMLGFTFDASGNLFNNTDYFLQSSTVSRVDTGTGAIAWTYRPPAGQFADVRADGPADFALAVEGPELVAIDKQDGHQRWRVNVDRGAQYATWYPTVLASHDVLITGELTLQADENHMLRVSHSLVDQTGVIRWTIGPASVLLTFNGSNPGRFVWEGRPWTAVQHQRGRDRQARRRRPACVDVRSVSRSSALSPKSAMSSWRPARRATVGRATRAFTPSTKPPGSFAGRCRASFSPACRCSPATPIGSTCACHPSACTSPGEPRRSGADRGAVASSSIGARAATARSLLERDAKGS